MSLTSIAVFWPVQLAGLVKNQSAVRQSRQITRTRRGFLIASSVAFFSCLYFIRTGKFLHPAWLQFSNSHSKTTDFYIKLRGEKTGLLFRKLVSEANRWRKSNPADRPKLPLHKDNQLNTSAY